MALLSSSDHFEPDQISPSVSPDDSQAFLDCHGLFYQADADIGHLVDNLYRTGHERAGAKLDSFKPKLQRDPRLGKILEPYLDVLPRGVPWGTTPEGYFAWSPTTNYGLVIYLLGSNSRFECCDGSHELGLDDGLADIGLHRIPDAPLEQLPKIMIEMSKGGVLVVLPGLAHRAMQGRSITFGGKPKGHPGQHAARVHKVDKSG